MCLKHKIASVALCAIIAVAGVFVAGGNTVQAENLTTASTAGLGIEQLQQLVLKLQEQIAYIIQLLTQQKPVCGNGVCETAKGETAATCAADCGTANICGKTDLLPSDGSRCTAAGGILGCVEIPCSAPEGSGCIAERCTCSCQPACAKEGSPCSISKCGASNGGWETKCIGGGSNCCAGLVCAATGSGGSSTCIRESYVDDGGKTKCTATGGNWKYLECMSGCGIPATKAERIKEQGMACPAVCVQGNGCACSTGKYWASREEGCLNREPVVSCLREGNIKELGSDSTVDCCPGLSRIGYCNDSGECKNAYICTAKCGNGICGDRENRYNCPADCNRTPVCGNGICETNEATVIGDPSFHGTCPSDCGGAGEEYAIGFQTGTCCACPKKIAKSQIGVNGWVLYQSGAEYSHLRPSNCQYVFCAPCEPL